MIAGCKKADLETTPNDELSSLSSTTTINEQACDVIDFETVNAGTLLSSLKSAGGVTVAMTSYNSSSPTEKVAAIVFDTDEPHWEDLDLGTPSINYGGPGKAGSSQSQQGLSSNNTPLHNITVIQNFIDFGNPLEPNDDDDRDATNEYITFDFSSVGTITANAITVIDVEKSEEREGGSVILYNTNGVEITRFPFPETYGNGVAKISLGNTSGVRSIKLDIDGSIGFDNLEFCVSQTPPPPPPPPIGHCTYTQGYWKTHGPDAKGNNINVWPSSIMSKGMKLGTLTYTAKELQRILNEPVKGNGLVSLAHQLIAANLNIANGSDPTSIQKYIDQANTLIGSKVIPPIGKGSISTAAVSTLVEKLTKYNEGTLPGGPKHCN
jgi:hypothetical protein